MTDRDHFAAAALTGLLVHANDGIDEETLDTPSDIAYTAYQMADAMLRERERKNHDAVPAAIARIDADRNRTDKAALRPGKGTGDTPAPLSVESVGFSSGSRSGQINRTPERESPRRECEESSLRDVPQPDNGRAAGGPEHFSYPKNDENHVFSDTIRATTHPRNGTPAEGSVGVSQLAIEPVAWAVLAKDVGATAAICSTFMEAEMLAARSADWRKEIVPLYRQPKPTLTDAEREAVTELTDDPDFYGLTRTHTKVLRGLLERMK